MVSTRFIDLLILTACQHVYDFLMYRRKRIDVILVFLFIIYAGFSIEYEEF